MCLPAVPAAGILIWAAALSLRVWLPEQHTGPCVQLHTSLLKHNNEIRLTHTSTNSMYIVTSVQIEVGLNNVQKRSCCDFREWSLFHQIVTERTMWFFFGGGCFIEQTLVPLHVENMTVGQRITVTILMVLTMQNNVKQWYYTGHTECYINLICKQTAYSAASTDSFYLFLFYCILCFFTLVPPGVASQVPDWQQLHSN